MIEILLIVIAFVILTLVVIWAHFISQICQKNIVDNRFRDETNVKLYHEHKAEIEKDFEQGSLDEESYQYLKTELDQSLLQDIEENSAEANQPKASTTNLSIVWPVALSVFILAFSGYWYTQQGAYELIANTPQVHESLDAQQQMVVQVQKLKKITEREPNNANAWYSLGQVLVGVGEFDKALSAFDKVIVIDGEKADFFGAKAQASYYKNEQKITKEVQNYIDKALSLDVNDPSTNILLGMDQFARNNYQQAISYWQVVIDEARPSVNLDALKGAIAEAKNRLALTGGGKAQAQSWAGPQLSLQVSTSEEVIEQLSTGEDRVVFVYAIPAEGSRMPVAAVKVKASDLPLRVVLNDALAMSPQAKLSDVEKVHIYAIVSKSGSVGIKSGDFKGELMNVSTSHNEVINLTIDHLVE